MYHKVIDIGSSLYNISISSFKVNFIAFVYKSNLTVAQ